MDLIYILNVIFIVFMTLYQAHYLSRYYNFGVINPITIELISSFPIFLMSHVLGPAFLLDDGVFDPYFNFAILMANIALVCKFILICITLHYLKKKFPFEEVTAPSSVQPRTIGLKVSSVFFLVLFFISFFILANSSFGLFNWLAEPRTGYQAHRSGAGQWFLLSIVFIAISYILMTISLKKNSSIFITFFIYIFFAYFLGTKGVLFSIAQYTIILFWFRKYRYIKKLIMVFVPIAFVGMLINFFSGQSTVDMLDVISYFDHFQNSKMYYQAYFNGEIDLFYGQIAFSNLWALVPRALDATKPYVYGIILINEYFWPGEAERTNTPAFGGPVAEFGDFGIVGVIIFSLFSISTIANTLIAYFLYRKKNICIEDVLSKKRYLYLFIWIFTQPFIAFFPFPLNIILFFNIIVIISIFNRLRW